MQPRSGHPQTPGNTSPLHDSDSPDSESRPNQPRLLSTGTSSLSSVSRESSSTSTHTQSGTSPTSVTLTQPHIQTHPHDQLSSTSDSGRIMSSSLPVDLDVGGIGVPESEPESEPEPEDKSEAEEPEAEAALPPTPTSTPAGATATATATAPGTAAAPSHGSGSLPPSHLKKVVVCDSSREDRELIESCISSTHQTDPETHQEREFVLEIIASVSNPSDILIRRDRDREPREPRVRSLLAKEVTKRNAAHGHAHPKQHGEDTEDTTQDTTEDTPTNSNPGTGTGTGRRKSFQMSPEELATYTLRFEPDILVVEYDSRRFESIHNTRRLIRVANFNNPDVMTVVLTKDDSDENEFRDLFIRRKKTDPDSESDSDSNGKKDGKNGESDESESEGEGSETTKSESTEGESESEGKKEEVELMTMLGGSGRGRGTGTGTGGSGTVNEESEPRELDCCFVRKPVMSPVFHQRLLALLGYKSDTRKQFLLTRTQASVLESVGTHRATLQKTKMEMSQLVEKLQTPVQQVMQQILDFVKTKRRISRADCILFMKGVLQKLSRSDLYQPHLKDLPKGDLEWLMNEFRLPESATRMQRQEASVALEPEVLHDLDMPFRDMDLPPPDHIPVNPAHVMRIDRDATLEALCSLAYNPLDYPIEELIEHPVLIFKHLNLFAEMRVAESTFRYLLWDLADLYRLNPYHNFRHAVDVMQFTFLFFLESPRMLKEWLNPFEQFSLLLSTLFHDVDHPGRSNRFLIGIKSPMAIRYNDLSVLENHHCAEMSTLIHRSRLLEEMKTHDKSFFLRFRRIAIQSILATDMLGHFSYVAQFQSKVLSMMSAARELDEEDARDAADARKHAENVEAEGEMVPEGVRNRKMDPVVELANPLGVDDSLTCSRKRHPEVFASENRILLMQLMMKCADISNQARPHHVARRWSHLVLSEFFAQGDEEKALGIPVNFLGDRTTVEIPDAQVKFIKLIVLPLFELLNTVIPIPNFLEGIKENSRIWESLKETEEAHLTLDELIDEPRLEEDAAERRERVGAEQIEATNQSFKDLEIVPPGIAFNTGFGDSLSAADYHKIATQPRVPRSRSEVKESSSVVRVSIASVAVLVVVVVGLLYEEYFAIFFSVNNLLVLCRDPGSRMDPFVCYVGAFTFFGCLNERFDSVAIVPMTGNNDRIAHVTHDGSSFLPPHLVAITGDSGDCYVLLYDFTRNVIPHMSPKRDGELPVFPLFTFHDHTKSVQGLTNIPDVPEPLFATATWNANEVFLWNPLREDPLLLRYPEAPLYVYRLLAVNTLQTPISLFTGGTGSASTALLRYDVTTGSILARFGEDRAHHGMGMDFDPERNLLVASAGRSIDLWDVGSSQNLFHIEDSSLVNSILVASDRAIIIEGLQNGQIVIRDTRNPLLVVKSFTPAGTLIQDLARFSEDEFVSASEKSIAMWNILAQGKPKTFPLPRYCRGVDVIKNSDVTSAWSHTDEIERIEFLHDGFVEWGVFRFCVRTAKCLLVRLPLYFVDASSLLVL